MNHDVVDLDEPLMEKAYGRFWREHLNHEAAKKLRRVDIRDRLQRTHSLAAAVARGESPLWDLRDNLMGLLNHVRDLEREGEEVVRAPGVTITMRTDPNRHVLNDQKCCCGINNPDGGADYWCPVHYHGVTHPRPGQPCDDPECKFCDRFRP